MITVNDFTYKDGWDFETSGETLLYFTMPERVFTELTGKEVSDTVVEGFVEAVDGASLTLSYPITDGKPDLTEVYAVAALTSAVLNSGNSDEPGGSSDFAHTQVHLSDILLSELLDKGINHPESGLNV